MSYRLLIHCKSLDDGRKALGLFMSMGIKHSKNETTENACPHCGETIPKRYPDEFIMSAKLDNLTTAIEILTMAVLSRLCVGIYHIEKE